MFPSTYPGPPAENVVIGMDSQRLSRQCSIDHQRAAWAEKEREQPVRRRGQCHGAGGERAVGRSVYELSYDTIAASVSTV